MDKALVYRSFRRRVIFATAGVFAIGLSTAFLLRTGGSLWAMTKWTAICSPVLVTVVVFLLLPVDQIAGRLGLASPTVRLRPITVFWMLWAIGLPWIAAWLMADLVGSWFSPWWLSVGGGGLPGVCLWAVRFIAGIITYGVASALGVLMTILMDSLEAGHLSH